MQNEVEIFGIKNKDVRTSGIMKKSRNLQALLQKVMADDFNSTIDKILLVNKSKFLVECSTMIKAGFDVSKVEVEETDSIVTVTIPHCVIDENSIKIKWY